MRVTVRLFAALRERAGSGRRELELPPGATAGDVFAALEIGAEPAGLAYAVALEIMQSVAVSGRSGSMTGCTIHVQSHGTSSQR